MLLIALIAVAGVAVTGLGFKYGLKYAVRRGLVLPTRRITGREFSVAMVVASLIVIPVVMLVGNKMSVDNALTYDELRHGTEQLVLDHPTTCEAGHSGSDASAGSSNCDWTYVSGHYTYTESYTETYSCPSSSDPGKTCTRTAYRDETAAIYTPYATVEHTYEVTRYIYNRHGSYTYPGSYLDAHPVRYGAAAIPPDIPRGAPADWLDAKRHKDAGDPRSVHELFRYLNFILASHDKMLAPFSTDVSRYLKQGILPDHTANILGNPIYGDSRPLVKELSVVGLKLANEGALQDSLMQFNAAFGSKWQGDLHAVVINSSLVDDPDAYTNAVRARWLGDHYGKRALAKNGVILVIGTRDGRTVDWARSGTGMPFGNGIMIEAVKNLLPGTALTPEAMFGHPSTVIKPATKPGAKDDVKVTMSQPPSALETIMFGANGFDRPCMICANGKGVGYSSEIDKIQPSMGWKIGMIAVAMALSLPFWWGVAATSFLEGNRRRNNNDGRDSSRDRYPNSRRETL